MINSFESKDFCSTEGILSFDGNFVSDCQSPSLAQSTSAAGRNPLLSASNFLGLDPLALSTCYEADCGAYENGSVAVKQSGEASPVPQVITDDQMFGGESGVACSPDKGQHSGCSITTTTACTSGSAVGQFGEDGYFRELAELVQASLSRPELLEGVNSSVLKETIRQLEQLKEKKQEEKFAVQHEDVSSTAPTLVASHIGPMLLEALDGFFFVLNAEGTVEFVSANVEKYLRYSQSEMVSQRIGNLVCPTDSELFSKLLPSLFHLHSTSVRGDDSLSLMDSTSTDYHTERRSHTFLCRFRVNSASGSSSARCQERPNRSDAARVELGSNELLSDMCGSPRRNDDSGFLSPTNNGGGIAPQRHFDGCQISPPSDGLCLYENLQVSAISLSYPMDGDRNEFLSTYSSVTEHTGAQPCLVCVARRLPGKCTSGGGSVACSPVDSDPTCDRFGGSQLLSVKPLVFSLKCTSDLTILAADFKDSGLQQLFSKDLFGMPVQCLCYQPDAPLFVDWLRRATRQCPEKSDTTVRFAINRKLLLLQARGTLCRPPNPFNSDYLQLEFRVLRIGDFGATTESASPTTASSRLSPSAFSRSQSALDVSGLSDGKPLRCSDVSPTQSNQSPTSTMVECGNKGDPNESASYQQGGQTNRIRPASSLGVGVTVDDYNFSGMSSKFQSYFGDALEDSSSVERFGDSEKRTSQPRLTKKLSSNSAHSDLLNEVSFGLDYLNSQAAHASTQPQKSVSQANSYVTNLSKIAVGEPTNSINNNSYGDNSRSAVSANELNGGAEAFTQEECGHDFFGDFNFMQFPNNKGDFDLSQMERTDHYMNMMTVANRDKLHELCSFVFGDEGLAGTSSSTGLPTANESYHQSPHSVTPNSARPTGPPPPQLQQQQFIFPDRSDLSNQAGPQDVILKELLTQDDVCSNVEPPPPKKKSNKRAAAKNANPDNEASRPFQSPQPDSNTIGNGSTASSSSAPPPTKKKRASQKNKILEQLLKYEPAEPVHSRAPMSAPPHPMSNFNDPLTQSACPMPSQYHVGSPNDQILHKLLRDNESQLNGRVHSNPSNLPDSSCFSGLMSPGGPVPHNLAQFNKWKSGPFADEQMNQPPMSMEEMVNQYGQPKSSMPMNHANNNGFVMPNRRTSPSPSVSSAANVGSSTHGVSKLVEKNCMLVKLLAQTPHTTPTLPTSIATSNYDKMAKENKENPNKPRVATGLVESLLNRNRTVPNQILPPPIGVNHVSSSTVPSSYISPTAASDQMLSQMQFGRHRPPAYNELDLYSSASNSQQQQNTVVNQPPQIPPGFPGPNNNWPGQQTSQMSSMLQSTYGSGSVGPNGDFYPPQSQESNFGGNSFNRGELPFMANQSFAGGHNGDMMNPSMASSLAQRHGMTQIDTSVSYGNQSQGIPQNRNTLVSSMLESRSQPVAQFSGNGNSKGGRREAAVRAALETPPNRQPFQLPQHPQGHMKRGRSVAEMMFETPDPQPDPRVMSVPAPLLRHESFNQFQQNLPGFSQMGGGDMQGPSQMPMASGPSQQGFNMGSSFPPQISHGYQNGLGPPPNSAPPAYGMNGRGMLPNFTYPPEEMRSSVQQQPNWTTRSNSTGGRGGSQRETNRNGRSQAQRNSQGGNNSSMELNLPPATAPPNMGNGPNGSFGGWNGSAGMMPNQNLLRAEMRKRAMSAANEYPPNQQQQRMMNSGGDGSTQSHQFYGNFPNGPGYQMMPGAGNGHPGQSAMMFDQQGQLVSYQQGPSNGGQDPNGLGLDFNFGNGGMEMEEPTDNILQQLLN